MEQEFLYQGQITQGDLMEVYAKTIANLGPFNMFYCKCFSYHGSMDDKTKAQLGFSFILYGRAHFAHIAQRLLDSKEPTKDCIMERHFLGMRESRRITIENLLDNQVRVEVKGSPGAVKKVRRIFDQMLTIDHEQHAMLEAVANALKGNKKVDGVKH